MIKEETLKSAFRRDAPHLAPGHEITDEMVEGNPQADDRAKKIALAKLLKKGFSEDKARKILGLTA